MCATSTDAYSVLQDLLSPILQAADAICRVIMSTK